MHRAVPEDDDEDGATRRSDCESDTRAFSTTLASCVFRVAVEEDDGPVFFDMSKFQTTGRQLRSVLTRPTCAHRTNRPVPITLKPPTCLGHIDRCGLSAWSRSRVGPKRTQCQRILTWTAIISELASGDPNNVQINSYLLEFDGKSITSLSIYDVKNAFS